jgi:hypothetical protein
VQEGITEAWGPKKTESCEEKMHMGQEEPSTIHPPARIVIAEEHPLFRWALRGVLSEQADLEVVGEAADGEQAVEQTQGGPPMLKI